MNPYLLAKSIESYEDSCRANRAFSKACEDHLQMDTQQLQEEAEKVSTIYRVSSEKNDESRQAHDRMSDQQADANSLQASRETTLAEVTNEVNDTLARAEHLLTKAETNLHLARENEAIKKEAYDQAEREYHTALNNYDEARRRVNECQAILNNTPEYYVYTDSKGRETREINPAYDHAKRVLDNAKQHLRDYENQLNQARANRDRAKNAYIQAVKSRQTAESTLESAKSAMRSARRAADQLPNAQRSLRSASNLLSTASSELKHCGECLDVMRHELEELNLNNNQFNESRSLFDTSSKSFSSTFNAETATVASFYTISEDKQDQLMSIFNPLGR